MKHIKNFGFWALFIIYIGLMVADFVTTLAQKDLMPVLEANPLYQLIPSIVPIAALNLLVLVLYVWIYTRPNASPTYRFFVIASMMSVIVLRINAIHNALYWLNNPVTVEQAKQMITPAVKQAFTQKILIQTYFPLLMNIITFLIWKWDHKIKIKGEN